VVEWIIGLLGYLVYLRMKKELPVVEDENGNGATPLEEVKASEGAAMSK